MSTLTDIGAFIAQTPGICGGRPRIAGTGVSIRRIIGWHKMGYSPEEIADQYGHLSLGQVYAALAYYHSHWDEIEADLAQEEREYNRLVAEQADPISSS